MNSFTGSPDKALKRFGFTHSGQKDHCILHKNIIFPQRDSPPSKSSVTQKEISWHSNNITAPY